MLGSYLTTAGRSPEKDLQMILDAGLNFENVETGNRETKSKETENRETGKKEEQER